MMAAARPALLAGLIVGVAIPGPSSAQQLVRAEDAVVALFSLQTDLEVDATMLRRLEQREEGNRKARAEARQRVERTYAELDQLFAQYRASRRPAPRAPRSEADPGARGADADDPEEGGAERLEAQIDAKEHELLAAERAEIVVQDEGRRMRDEMRRLRERMTVLAQRMESLAGSLPTQKDAVTGIWDVSILPGGDKGVFALFQSGTLVTGQYVIDGPFQGSLDGTLIDRKLMLHRIDARLGRSMDLSAFLSPDGQALRGTWENYDLSDGQPRSGSWSARRRRPAGSPPEEGREGVP